MPEFGHQFARRVRYLRQQRNWSQARLGKAAGLTLKSIGQIERAEVSPTLASLTKIAKALNLTVSDLVSVFKRGRSKPRDTILFVELSRADILTVRKALDVLNRVFR